MGVRLFCSNNALRGKHQNNKINIFFPECVLLNYYDEMYKYPGRKSGYKYCAKLEPLTTTTITVSTVTSSPITSTTTTTKTTTTTTTPLPYCQSNDINFTEMNF